MLLASQISSLEQLRLLPEDSFYVTVNGRIVPSDELVPGQFFQVHFRLRGGKGGFGSLLRSFRIHRSTNQLMCRDLEGRRLADVKEEEKLRKWIGNAEEREKEKRRLRKEKYDKLKSGPPKHEFSDPGYIQTREKLLEEADDAFDAGMAMLSSTKKRKNPSHKEEEDTDMPGPSGVKIKKSAYGICVKKPKLGKHEGSDGKKAATPAGDLLKRYDGKVDDKKIKEMNEKKETPPVMENIKVAPVELVEINLDDFENVESLHAVGLDNLKHALEVRGLKCGGSLGERANRLFAVKGLHPDDYPKAFKAAPPKKKSK